VLIGRGRPSLFQRGMPWAMALGDVACPETAGDNLPRLETDEQHPSQNGSPPSSCTWNLPEICTSTSRRALGEWGESPHVREYRSCHARWQPLHKTGCSYSHSYSDPRTPSVVAQRGRAKSMGHRPTVHDGSHLTHGQKAVSPCRNYVSMQENSARSRRRVAGRGNVLALAAPTLCNSDLRGRSSRQKTSIS
jgi:hypothetical protein